MNERSNLMPVTEDEIREHYGRISRGAIFIAKDDAGELFDAVEAYVRLRESRVVDPRIARIKALCAQAEQDGYWADAYMTQALRTALNGGDV